MKLIHFYKNNQLYWGMVEASHVIPCPFQGRFDDLIQQDIYFDRTKTIALEEIRYAPPVLNPSKIIAIGLNYKDHAQEGKIDIPKHPLVFTKFSNALQGHQNPIIWNDSITQQVDFEAELAVIIGKKIYRASEQESIAAVYGYTIANDVSARDLQFGDGQWVRGKSLNTFCPLGPWIVTVDDIPDPHQLSIQCRLNGQIMQNSSTDQMIFSITELISFLSYHFTLFPGDIILTGTPSGVGVFRKPPIFLKNNDEIIVEISSIGQLINTCQINKDNL